MLRKLCLKMVLTKEEEDRAQEGMTTGAMEVCIYIGMQNCFFFLFFFKVSKMDGIIAGGYGNSQGGWNNSNPWDNNQGGGWGGNQGGGYGGGNQRGGGGGWGSNQDFGSYNQQGYSGGPTRSQQYSNNRSAPYNVNQGGGGGGYSGNYGGGQGRGGRF